MPFIGKATYSAGADLPELMEDVSDIIGIVSPFETPLLDHLGDGQRPATSVVHEWLEDELLPNTDTVADQSFSDPENQAQFKVDNASRFRAGDQIKLAGEDEVLLVIAVSGDQLAVIRRYGGTPDGTLTVGAVIMILGNAALEGDVAPDSRFTSRARVRNYTQIFTASVEVSGSQLAASTHGVSDEIDYQKQNRLRELLRDLENCVINGAARSTDPQGNENAPRTMRGIIPSILTNTFQPGADGIPDGDGDDAAGLTEDVLNAALRNIWNASSGRVDTILCGGVQKRKINGFMAPSRRFEAEDRRFQSLVDIYESDYGICNVIMSRWVQPDTVLLLDSSRIDVLPLAGRSFGFKTLAATGDHMRGQVIGEYTLEVRNESAHGMLSRLDTSLAA